MVVKETKKSSHCGLAKKESRNKLHGIIFVSALIWRLDEEITVPKNTNKKPWWVYGTLHDTPPTETKKYGKTKDLNSPTEMRRKKQKWVVLIPYLFSFFL
ncbi:hypothetical protein VIGAN_09168300 [Vigna angularis var. angularis]|uniref:Uncharacterized protein n=1 Tax=Vigna angularis var. angularis TaxID=157739 RepID=A0A0S3SZ96_PHAAN|nr:hypothetical protein VIGAN_09168300 [Vigna angularis var. angularis]